MRYQQAAEYQKINLHTLGEYLEAFRKGGIKLPYLRHISINNAMPELRSYSQDPQEFSPNWVTHPYLDKLGGPELFIGQQGTSFGHLHQDHQHTAGDQEHGVLVQAREDSRREHGDEQPSQGATDGEHEEEERQMPG